MDKKIELFTSSTCSFCHKVKAYFKEKNIQFEEKMIDPLDKEQKVLIELKERTGQLGVPVIFVEGMDDPIIGFDVEKINEVLGL